MRSLLVLSLTAILLGGCASVRYVEPLPDKHLAATATLGGPFITYSDLVIPMPLTSLGAGYGYSPTLTLFGGLHTTALLFKDLQLDLGALQRVLDQNGWQPAVSASAVANLALALRDGRFKFWPELDANAYWHYDGSGNLAYVSLANWFELSSTRAHGEQQEYHWIPIIAVGHTFDATNWQYTTEVKYIAPATDNSPNVVEYHGIGGQGGLGFYFSLTRKF